MNSGYKEISKKSNKMLIKSMMFLFLILFVISLLVLFFIEKSVRKTRFEELVKKEENIVALENIILDKEYRMVLEDLKFLQHTFNNVESNNLGTDRVAEIWREFSTHRNIYDQIRYINCSGDEIIRINFKDDRGEIVSDNLLQNKADRYYFSSAIQLSEEEVYISPLDLNVENNKIEEPHKPVIRIATPLFSEEKELKGIIVLNYLADHMIEAFRDMGTNSAGEIALLNAEGYWLSSGNPELEYTFMFEDSLNQNYANSYPDEWSRIKNDETNFMTTNGLFISMPVDLNPSLTMDAGNTYENKIILSNHDWYIVSTVPRDDIRKMYFSDDDLDIVMTVLQKNIYYFLLIVGISILVAYLITLNRKAFMMIKFYSEFDALTETYNRRAGIEKLKSFVSIKERRKFNISLCFIDVNGLKTVNDQLGHKFGDELILSAVHGIRDNIRKNDFIIRFGGDEFLIVLCSSNLEDAERIWARIVEGYEYINQKENRPYLLSVSHGIVEVTHETKVEIEELIKAADEKMYEEKRLIKETLHTLRTIKQ